MLTYAYAIDSNTNKIIWSSDKHLYGKHVIDANRILRKEKKDFDSAQEIQGATEHYTIIMGLTQGKTQNNNIHIMFENMKIFVFILLLFGVVASAIMSRIINSPLVRLTKGVKEFAGGNF